METMRNHQRWVRVFPFLNWIGELRQWRVLRADILAGITVAMFLIPQSMAYARLAGMPAYYGLYAGFLPPIIAALFGSSRLLSTGPIAITSLLTGATLQAIVPGGTDEYLQYVFLFTLLAGMIQFFLGVFHLGIVINFLSHPVLLGFVNAASLIIASAQISSMLGLTVMSSKLYYQTFWRMLNDAFTETHWPTLGIALLALMIMLVGRRFRPKSPYILMALVITTIMAWYFNYDRSNTIEPNQIVSLPAQAMLQNLQDFPQDMANQIKKVSAAEKHLDQMLSREGESSERTGQAFEAVTQAKWELKRLITKQQADKNELFLMKFRQLTTPDGREVYFVDGQMTAMGQIDSLIWRITNFSAEGEIDLHAGGRVLGDIPLGLPAFSPITVGWDQVPRLLISALAIALLGFVEAITVAKRMATDKRQQWDVNQELIGQGLAKVVGSFFQSMPVSGGFSRSAINYEVGAKTGFSSVIAGLFVMVVLLWFTELFYYVPEATLAAVILVTVLGLVDFKAMWRTWQVNRNEGIVAWITFMLTIVFAPRLEFALLLGMLLSLGVYLHETMRPRFSELLRAEDGDLIEFEADNEESHCQFASMVRYGGSLYFANAAYFEDCVISLLSIRPNLKYLILDCARMNKLDASGLETLHKINARLHEAGLELWLTRVPQGVMQILKRTGFYEALGAQHVFKHNEDAIAMLAIQLGARHMRNCPLARPQDDIL